MKRKRPGSQAIPLYLFIVVLFLVLSSFFLYKGLKDQRVDTAKADLLFEGRIILQLLEKDLSDSSYLETKRLNYLLRAMKTRRWIAVFDKNGRTLWSSLKTTKASGLTRAANQALQGQRVFFWIMKGEGGTRFFALILPIQYQEEIEGALGVAVNERELDPLQGEFWLALVWLMVLAATFSFVSARLMRIRFDLEAHLLTEAIKKVTSGHLNLSIQDASNILKQINPLITGLRELKNVTIWYLELINKGFSQCKDELEKLSLLFENMKEAVFLLDFNKRILTMNRAAEGILNVSGKNVAGRPITNLIRDLHLKELIDDIYLQKKDMQSEIILYTGTDDLIERIYELGAVVLRSHNSEKLTGVLVVMDDRTRLKKLEETRREFVANVSHELKTPVTAIKGYVETLLEGVDDKEMEKRFLKILRRQSARLETLVEDVLTLSKMDSDIGKPKLNISRVRLCMIIEEAIETCRVLAQSKGIEIKVKCHDPGLEIEVDLSLMVQALTNLLVNAVNYSEDGNKVFIKTSKSNGEVQIAVRDQGPGIRKSDQDRIFERFYRADKARSRALGGTGLGLAIVKHIVMAHKGSISVESELGRGSTFTISVPVRQTNSISQTAR